jgi:hypothetical protein
LPEPPAAGAGLGGQLLLPDGTMAGGGSGLWGALGDEPPAAADYIFDCIRVTWVVLIVCILFLGMSVNAAFVAGGMAGCCYVAVSTSWGAIGRWRQQQAAAAAAAEAAGWGGWTWRGRMHPHAADDADGVQQYQQQHQQQGVREPLLPLSSGGDDGAGGGGGGRNGRL